MWDSKKKITTFASAMVLSLASMGAMPFSASATETTKAVTTTAEEETTSTTTATTSEAENGDAENLESADFDEMMELFGSVIDGSEEDAVEPPDYYADDYYDTDGNATLIKHEKIIYESEEMQFIAVTTKDGDVFYILINYSAEDDEDNVYFLNKVDSFDLYSLLYAEDENSDESANINPAEQAELYADAATGGHYNGTYKDNSTPDVTEAENPEDTETQPVSSGMMNNNILLIGGIGVLAVIAFIIFMLKSGKLGGGKKKVEDIGDFEEEDDYEDYGNVEDENE